MNLESYASRAEWLAARRTGLGGTDIARILGIAPTSWGGPVRVWVEKTDPQAPAIEETEAMRWGRVLEAPIAAEWARRAEMRIETVPGILRHPEHPWAVGTPDRIVTHPDGARVGVLEVKTIASWHARGLGHDGAEGTEETLPAHWMVQLQWYLGLAGLPRGWFAVLVGGQDFRSLPVERDEDLIAAMLARCGAWWQRHVIEGAPPEPDGSPDAGRWLESEHPVATNAEPVDLGSDAARWAAEYVAAQARAAEAETEAVQARQLLERAMGDAAKGFAGRYVVAWTNVAGRRGLDVTALKVAHPDIYQRFETQGAPSRRFSVRETKP